VIIIGLFPKKMKSFYKKLFYIMKRIRFVEEKIALKYPEGKMRCPTHLSIGQELMGGLVGLFLKKNDYAVSTHRAHAHYLGKGGDLKSLIAELYGKETGCSLGHGGSMHLIDDKVSFMGSTAIVGSNIPIGVGLSLSIKLDRKNNISCIFLGDGAVEEGVFYESLNFSAVKKTPALFICENNNYSVYSPMEVRQPQNRTIHEMVKYIGLQVFFVDSKNIEMSVKIFQEAVDFVRKNKQPAFFEMSTYRWREHCGPNFDDHLNYRPNGELLDWQASDPLKKIEEEIIKSKYFTKSKLKEIELNLKNEIDEAFEFAEKSNFPSENKLFLNEYAT